MELIQLSECTIEARDALSDGSGDDNLFSEIAVEMSAIIQKLKKLDSLGRAGLQSKQSTETLASRLLSHRRRVDEVFMTQGFSASPAWDIMLDLVHARNQSSDVSVSAACIGANCPMTTGLRWIGILEEMQLIVRKPDPADRRRIWIELTNIGIGKTQEALASF